MNCKGWCAAAMVLSASGCSRVVTDAISADMVSMRGDEITLSPAVRAADEKTSAAGNARPAWSAAFTQ